MQLVGMLVFYVQVAATANKIQAAKNGLQTKPVEQKVPKKVYEDCSFMRVEGAKYIRCPLSVETIVVHGCRVVHTHKYDFRSNSITSLSGYYKNSHNCFRKENITIHKRRRFARKARDYQRAYRAGAMGLEAEIAIKKVKTHRCALDTDTAFIVEHCTEEPLTIVWVD